MATVTGEYAINFATESNENPWVDANFTLRTAATGRIESGVLTGSTTCWYEHSGGAYDGGDVTAKMELGATSGGGDYARCGCLDENGDGYVFSAGDSSSNNCGILRYDNWVYAAVVQLTTVGTLASGSEIAITVTKGSPNTIVVTHNGSQIQSTTDSGATLGTVHAGLGTVNGNVAGTTIRSFAVDGLSGGGGASASTKQAFYRMLRNA